MGLSTASFLISANPSRPSAAPAAARSSPAEPELPFATWLDDAGMRDAAGRQPAGASRRAGTAPAGRDPEGPPARPGTEAAARRLAGPPARPGTEAAKQRETRTSSPAGTEAAERPTAERRTGAGTAAEQRQADAAATAAQSETGRTATEPDGGAEETARGAAPAVDEAAVETAPSTRLAGPEEPQPAAAPPARREEWPGLVLAAAVAPLPLPLPPAAIESGGRATGEAAPQAAAAAQAEPAAGAQSMPAAFEVQLGRPEAAEPLAGAEPEPESASPAPPRWEDSEQPGSSGEAGAQEPPYTGAGAAPAFLLDDNAAHILGATLRNGPLAAGRESAPPPAAAPQAQAPVEPPAAAPVKSLNLHFEDPNGKSVLVRVSDSAGGVNIKVHAEDERLAHAYRTNLRELSEQFDRNGIQATARASEPEQAPAAPPAARPEEQARHPDRQGQQQRQQQEQARLEWRRRGGGGEPGVFSLAAAEQGRPAPPRSGARIA